MMTNAPKFIDNRDGNTLALALRRVLGGRLGGEMDEAPAARPTDATWYALPGDTILRERGTCLRIAECEPETPRVVPRGLEEERIFDLWAAAQADIWQAWMVETDPANLQPKLRPLNRRVAGFIRATLLPDVDGDRVIRALDILESPWPRREEVMLRGWFSDETCAGVEKAEYLIDRVLETGLEPFKEPPTLPPIRLDEIELTCWLAISPAAGEDFRG